MADSDYIIIQPEELQTISKMGIGIPEAGDIDLMDESAFVSRISRLLASTYEAIIRLEDCVYRSHGIDLTSSELNLLSTVGRAVFVEHKRLGVSDVAQALGIKKPSATSAVNRLVEKGYLEKRRNKDDARRVDVMLTRAGERIYRMHAVFNRRMAQEVSDGLTPEERKVLLEGITRLERAYTRVEREAVARIEGQLTTGKR